MSSAGSCDKDDDGSCGAGHDGGQPREPPVPARWAAYSRPARRWKAWATTPGLLLALGILLLAVGAALVATPLTIRARSGGGAAPRPPPQPQPASVNAEGVPIGAVPADQQQQQGKLVDCRLQLRNRTAYTAAAAAAEARLLGAAAQALPRPELQRAVDSLPPLLFGTVFWVLVSESHPWTPEFQAAAATQVNVLNAAFEELNWRFRLDGVVQVPAALLENVTGSPGSSGDCSSADDFELGEGSSADCPSSGGSSGDAVVEQCLLRWAKLERALLPPPSDAAALSGTSSSGGGSSSAGGQPDPPAIHVVVCEPQGVNGATLVLGDAAAGRQEADEEDGSGAGAPSGGTVLLRRGALWQSRTSLVHQLGHFFGLPHPFPDDKHTCKLDGDGIADTPQQYAANTGCQQEGGDQHVCPTAGDGPVAATELPVPIVNYMDLTNDTCRRHFTVGQAARMQAMLRWQRPRLFAAASGVPPAQQALAWDAAWQSGLPPAVVQQRQREGAVQQALLALNSSASGGGTSSSSSSSSSGSSADSLGAVVEAAGNAVVLYADGWAQAGFAADGKLSTALQDCACIGPDAAGELFWTGQLNASYPIAAVRLLLPIQPGGNSSSAASSSADSSSSEEEAAVGDATAEAEADPADKPPEEAGAFSSAPTAEAVPAQGGAAPAPAPATAAAAVAGPASVPAPPLLLDVWIGDSLNHTQNQRCTSQLSVQQGQLVAELRCDAPLPVGCYVTVAVAAAAQQRQQQQQQQQQVCLCEVQALPAVSPTSVGSSSRSSSDSSGGTPSSALPAAPLNITVAVASQSSDAKAWQGGAASVALARWPPQLGRQQCSSTGGERAPWWSLDTGLDGAWVHGLRLALPLPCMYEAVLGARNASARAAQDCVPPLPANLTVFVGDTPPAQLLERTGGSRDGSSLCTAGVAVPAGRPTVIDCGRFMHGRYITVTASAPLGTVLSLCNLQLLGGDDLPLSQHMLPQRKPRQHKGSRTAAAASDGSGALRVSPASLQPVATLPINGNSSSCLLAPAGSSNGNSSSNGTASWQLHLDGTYSVLAVRLAATAAGSVGNGSRAASSAASSALAVSLLDAGGAAVASWRTAGSSGAGNGSDPVLLELPAATHAAAVRVEGFASLCDLQLLVASSRKVAAYQLAPLASLRAGGSGGSNVSSTAASSMQPGGEPQAAGQWEVLNAATGSALTASLASALLDGDPSTCAVLRPVATLGGLGALRPLAVELRLDRPIRLEAVRLLASARRNVTVKAAAPRSQGAPRLDLSVVWPAAAICQERVELPPWQPVYSACRPAQGKASSTSAPLLTDRLLLQLADTTAAANATADDLTLQLCGLELFGLPAAAGS